MSLYPFLFILEILLIPFVRNLDQLDASQAILPALLLLAATTLCLLLFHLRFKDWQYAAYLTFLVGLYFCGFGYFNRFVQSQLSLFGRSIDEAVLLLLFTFGLGLLSKQRLWMRLGGRTWLPAYLNLAIGLGLLVPAGELLVKFVDQPEQAQPVSLNTPANQGELTLTCGATPDIYYIILDGYGRADMLAELYGIDNQPFLDYLRSKGFYVAAESYTNYTQTLYSLPSSLNFSYIAPPGEGVSRAKYFANLMRSNQIMQALKRCGYHTVAFESGFYFTEHPLVDQYLAHGLGTNEYESLLLADSPVDVLVSEVNPEFSDLSYAAHRRRVLFSFEKLATLSQLEAPTFAFAHIISPHPPFVFDQNGQPLEPARSYYIGDGDDYQGSLEEYRAGYQAQVVFVNAQLQHMLDSILANSTSPPVIILQADHGPGSQLVWDAPEQSCLYERTSILNAYYLPGEVSELLYTAISPVNSFRIVLNAYFGTRLPFLPDDTYFSSHDYERQVIDITAGRSSRANCEATE